VLELELAGGVGGAHAHHADALLDPLEPVVHVGAHVPVGGLAVPVAGAGADALFDDEDAARVVLVLEAAGDHGVEADLGELAADFGSLFQASLSSFIQSAEKRLAMVSVSSFLGDWCWSRSGRLTMARLSSYAESGRMPVFQPLGRHGQQAVPPTRASIAAQEF
jgi:hypothetical protein